MGILKKSPSFNAIYEIGSSAGIVFLGMFLGEILMFATRMIAARSLGPADYGVLNLGLVILALFQTLSLIGLPPAISRYIPFYLAKGQLSNVKGTITSGLRIAISTSFFLAAFLFVLSRYIAVNIFKKDNLQIVISIFALTIPFTVAAEYFYASLRGFKKTKYAVLSKQIVFRSCTFLFLIILLALNIKLVGASIAYSLGFVMFALTSLYLLNFRTFSFFKTDVSGSKMAKTLLSFSYPLILSFFLKQTQNRVDTILLGVFTSSTQVGLYNAALPISQILSIFLQSVLFMFAPIIAELYAQRKYNELKFIYKSVTKIILYLSLIPFLIMLFFPKSLLTLLFGKNYASATGVLRILLFAFFINSIFGPVGSMLINIKKTRHYMLGDLIGVFTSIALSLILIPRLGISGAAYGILAYMFLANSIRLLSVYHYLKIQPFDINYLIIPVSVGLVIFILRQLLDAYLGVHELVILFICAVPISFFILVFAYRDFTKQGFNFADLVGEIRKKRM